MRDVLVMALVLAGAVAALRRPWIGVILWNWVSLMNPHRYTYGFAYDAPVAAIAAVSTLIGFLATRDRHWPFRGAAPVFLLVFLAWLTLSWSLGVDPSDDYEQWTKVMKVDVMIFVALSLLRTKLHVFCFVWVCAGSLALLGAKGGVFTVMNGGNFHVWGPPGSFIEDNNNFALALVMTIPLVRFLQMQCTSRLARHGLTVVMMLLAASALGSQSRGADHLGAAENGDVAAGVFMVVGAGGAEREQGRSIAPGAAADRVEGGLRQADIGQHDLAAEGAARGEQMARLEAGERHAEIGGADPAAWLPGTAVEPTRHVDGQHAPG